MEKYRCNFIRFGQTKTNAIDDFSIHSCYLPNKDEKDEIAMPNIIKTLMTTNAKAAMVSSEMIMANTAKRFLFFLFNKTAMAKTRLINAAARVAIM